VYQPGSRPEGLLGRNGDQLFLRAATLLAWNRRDPGKVSGRPRPFERQDRHGHADGHALALGDPMTETMSADGR
jgi:hypothetical protein